MVDNGEVYMYVCMFIYFYCFVLFLVLKGVFWFYVGWGLGVRISCCCCWRWIRRWRRRSCDWCVLLVSVVSDMFGGWDLRMYVNVWWFDVLSVFYCGS